MSLDWTNVQKITPAIQTTASDVVLSGHGTFELEESKYYPSTTVVPHGVELWLFAPPGASLADLAGQAIESGAPITRVGLKNRGSDILNNNTPIVVPAGRHAPNYVLHAPDGIKIKPGVAHLIGVEKATPLSELWARIEPFIKHGTTIRCFWAACTALDGATNPVVLVK